MHLGSCFPCSQDPISPRSPATSWHQVPPGNAPTARFYYEAEEWRWSTLPKALSFYRTADLSFDRLVLSGWGVKQKSARACSAFCSVLWGSCSVLQFSLPEGSSTGLLLDAASYCCSAMKSEGPQTSRGPSALTLLCSSGQQQLLNSSAAKAHYHFPIIK